MSNKSKNMEMKVIKVRKANSMDNLERVCTVINEAFSEKYKKFGFSRKEKEKRIKTVEQEGFLYYQNYERMIKELNFKIQILSEFISNLFKSFLVKY